MIGHVKIICPYHQWVYDKDGTYLMQDDARDFDKKLITFSSCACRRRIDLYLFRQSSRVFSHSKSLSPYLQPYKINAAKLASKKNIPTAN
jgi:Rieske 2Fe-2S family protein